MLARAYLADEPGHAEVRALLEDTTVAVATGTWTRIEVSGALTRAGLVGRVKADDLLALFDADLGVDGLVTVLGAAQAEVEAEALAFASGDAAQSAVAQQLGFEPWRGADGVSPG